MDALASCTPPDRRRCLRVNHVAALQQLPRATQPDALEDIAKSRKQNAKSPVEQGFLQGQTLVTALKRSRSG
ncbi:hypothetical protein [Acidovorax sp. LjRoot194]|uniref:hypothetical protein n=1 Tax=Acidovorax sp. LjRoot194 TaxID=3342280 RepID=UPI003ED0529B